MSRAPLYFLLALGAAQQPPEERALTLGASVTEPLGGDASGSVAFFKYVVPPELGSFFVQLTGCGTGADGQPAPSPRPGKEAADVKAFLSFTTPRPSLWDAQHRLSWCSDEPTLLAAPQPGNQTYPTVLHISVFASAPSRFTLAVTRSTRELSFGELSTYVVNCRYEDFASRLAFQKHVGPQIASQGRSCAHLAVRIPSNSSAIIVRGHAQQLPSPPPATADEYHRQNYHMDPSRFGAMLSLTATNLTVLPASWAMMLSGSVGHAGTLYQPIADGELLIPRSSPAFCRVEPCIMTVQLFADDISQYNITFSVTMGIFDAVNPSASYDRVRRLSAVDHLPQCAPGCEQDFVADGVCHEACLDPACRDDGGDCEFMQERPGGYVPTFPFCAPGCRLDFLGDGLCDDACFVRSCGWDSLDCKVAIRAQRLAKLDEGDIDSVIVEDPGIVRP